MSDFLETDDDDLDEPTVTLSQADAKAQRALARKGEKFDAAVADASAAKRELAFLKAGIDTESPVGKLFVRGFDGEVSVEAIKAAAAEIPGLIAEAAPAAEAEPTPEEAEAARAEAEQTSQRQQLSSGNANAGTPTPPDPRELMAEAATAARKAGASDETALVAGLGELVNAAANNDPRVRIHVWDSADA